MTSDHVVTSPPLTLRLLRYNRLSLSPLSDYGCGPTQAAETFCSGVINDIPTAAGHRRGKDASSQVHKSQPVTSLARDPVPNFDRLPDQNHGGNLLETTYLNLPQSDVPSTMLLASTLLNVVLYP